MIDEIDGHLIEWVQKTLGTAVDVTLALPLNTPQGQGVSVYLFALSDMPPPRGLRRTPIQFSLRYLVTAWAEEPEAAHRMLGELAFAALERADWEVRLEPLSAELWLACSIAPRPAFVLCVPARRERPEPETRYVRVPLGVQTAPLEHIYGVLLGPGDYPLVDALVHLVDGAVSTRTDGRGRFRLAYVAVGTPPRLRIVAKGSELETAIQKQTSENEPLVIHFDPFGEKEG